MTVVDNKHTRLPFGATTVSEIVYGDPDLFTIYDEFHNVVGYTNKKADAEFIASACNGYYSDKEIINELLAALNGYHRAAQKQGWSYNYEYEFKAAEEAMLKAKGNI